jgi:hypothetical protein
VSRAKKSLRITLFVLAIAVAGFLVSAVVAWRVVANPEPEPVSTSNDVGSDRLAAFLQRRNLATAAGDSGKSQAAARVLQFSNAVGEFRERAVRSVDTAAMLKLPRVEPGALRDLLGTEMSLEFPYIWPYVLAGSFYVIGNVLSEDAIAGFYNPYFDVVILTRWRYTDDRGFRLERLVPVTGRAFLENRSSRVTDEPAWTELQGLFEVRLVHAAQGFANRFEQLYPVLAREARFPPIDDAAARAAVSATETRVFYLMKWVIDAQDPAAPVNYAAAIETLQSALTADSADALAALLPADNPQGAEFFLQLDPAIRAGLKPYLVVEKNVIFIDPVNLPTAFLSVYFEPAGGGYVPGLIALFNLEAVYPRD